MQGGHKEEKKSLEEHELAEKIRKSGQVGNVLFLSGYIGEADSSEIVRLYIDLNFDSFVDIPKNSIIHTAMAPDNVLPFGGKYVWISGDTHLSRVDIGADREQARFLEGRISKRYVSAEAAEPTTDRTGFVKRIRRAAKSDYCTMITCSGIPGCLNTTEFPGCPPATLNLQQCSTWTTGCPY